MDNATSTRKEIKSRLRLYSIGKRRREILVERRQRLMAELHPATIDQQSEPDPNLETLDQQIAAQIQSADRMMLEAVELMAQLPPGSKEQLIVELRHIDGANWKEITATLDIAKSTAFVYYNAALDFLIQHKSTGEPA